MMSGRMKSARIWIAVAVGMLVLLAAGSFIFFKTRGNAVACVYSQKIYESELGVEKKESDRTITAQQKKILSPAKFEEWLKERRKSDLKNMICDIVRLRYLEENRNSLERPSMSNMKAHRDQVLAQSKKVAPRMIERRKLTIKALERVIVNGENTDLVYAEILKGRMTKRFWDEYTKLHTTKEDLEKEKKHAERNNAYDQKIIDIEQHPEVVQQYDSYLLKEWPIYGAFYVALGKKYLGREIEPISADAKRAMKMFLQDMHKKGVFEIYDPEYETRFWVLTGPD